VQNGYHASGRFLGTGVGKVDWKGEEAAKVGYNHSKCGKGDRRMNPQKGGWGARIKQKKSRISLGQ